MGHNLATNEKTGEKAFFGIEPAWHGLGKVLDNPATAAEAIEHAGLDFDVLQKPVMFNAGTEESPIITELDNKVVNFRSDNKKPLGVVSDKYTPVQNRDSFKFFDALIDENEAIYHAAGALGDGEKIWVLAKMPDHIRVGKDDLIEQYVLLYNSHNGSSAVTACLTPIRVVCNNTLTAALRTTQHKVSIRHTTNALTHLSNAHEVLGLSSMYAAEMEEIFNNMAKKQVVSKDIEAYLDRIYPINPDNETLTAGKKIRAGIMEAMEIGAGADMETAKGTVFGLYNAVTYYTDHMKDFSSESSKMKSIMMGGTANIRQKAFDAGLELVLN